MARTMVIALGGNAILKPWQRGTAEEQLENVRETCRHIARLIGEGHRVVITHGNGPQVGNILIQNEEASGVVPPLPLDMCGAESQGLIGYMIQRSLDNELRRQGLERPVVSLVTQVIVDREDRAFAEPVKPIGPFYTAPRARKLMQRKGYRMREDAERGWRRVVPSPDPVGIYERRVIRWLVEAGVVVVACGGGGIPVYLDEDGELRGAEAVVDKDLAGQRLARDVGAELLVMLTDVDRVALNFGRPNQRWIERMTAAEARRYMAEGHFRPGSMAPKVEAAIRFVEQGGRMAIIASLERAAEALRGEAGTAVVP